MILKLAAVCGLIVAVSCYLDETEFDRDGDTPPEIQMLLTQGFTMEEINSFFLGRKDKANELEETEWPSYSWQEAKGYEDCEEFKYHWKDNSKKWDEDNSIADNDVDRLGGDEDYNEFTKDFKPRNKRSPHGKYGHHHRSRDGPRPNHGQPGPQGRPGSDGYKPKNCNAYKPKLLSEICAEVECPLFEKLDIAGCGFEARRIAAANWIATPVDISTGDFLGDFKAAYLRLRDYISGANELGVKMNMTAPVITRMVLDDNYKPLSSSMYFYIPSEHQAAPPAPTGTDVSVVYWATAVTYDRAFGGTAYQQKYERYFTNLFKALTKEEIAFEPTVAYVAGYTKPWDRIQRHEVMYLSTDDELIGQ